jgi:predicted TPR repeat methyltransferase
MATPQIERILALIAQRKSTEALAYCDEALNTDPHNVEILQLQATCYAHLHQYNQACTKLLQALSLEPQNVVLHNNLSNIYKMQGNIEQALRHLHEALYLNPDKASTHHNLGNLYYKIGKIDDAIECYHKCLRLSPNFYEAHFNLANCYVKQEQNFKAIEHYLSFLQYDINHYQANINLGMLYISLQNFAEALPWLLQGLTIQDITPEVHGHIADCYLELGNNQKAIEHYEIVNKATNNAGWLHNLAVLYLRNQEHNKAIEYFKKTLMLNEHNYTAQHMLNALQNKQTSNMPAQYTAALFDQYAGYYDQHMKTQLSYDLPTKFRHLIAENQLKNILDLGCGTGLCGLVFRDQAKNLVGVDLSCEMLKMAAILGAYDCLIQANINDALPGLAQDYFEIILAAEVLGYIGDLDKIFNNISETLAFGGKFIFSIELQAATMDSANFWLQNSGRFCHHPNYIISLAQKYKLNIVYTEETILRQSAHGKVLGQIFILTPDKKEI